MQHPPVVAFQLLALAAASSSLRRAASSSRSARAASSLSIIHMRSAWKSVGGSGDVGPSRCDWGEVDFSAAAPVVSAGGGVAFSRRFMLLCTLKSTICP